MSGDSFDANGEAHEALSTAVGSYGARVLGDPRILGNLVTDLLPDMPRERSLLVAAAEAGVAAELTQHVEGQRLDVETAIALVARSLTENRLLDPAASIWVSTEYAQALGYQVRPQAAPTVAQKAFGPTPTETVSPPQSPPVPPLPTIPPPPAKSASFTPAASSGGETRIDLRPAPRFTPTQPPPAAPASPPPVATPAAAAPPVAPPPAATPPASPPTRDPWQPAPASTGDPWQQPTLASIPDPWAKGAAAPPVQQPPQPQNAWQQPAPPGPAQPGSAQPWPSPSNGGGGTPWPSTTSTGPRRPRRALLLGGGVALVLVLYMIVAAVAQTFPFSKSAAKSSSGPKVVVSSTAPGVNSSSPVGPTSPSAGPTSPSAGPTSPSVGPSSPGVVTTTPPPAGPRLAPGVKPLKVLLPTDVVDASTECSTQTDIPWTNPGLVRAVECSAADMSGGNIFGYQVDNSSDFAKAWANYNTWAKFAKSSSEACPPPTGQDQAGPIEWSNSNFPQRSGQVLECFTANKGEGVYIWTYPTEDTFIIVQAPKAWTYSQLHQWWRQNAA